MQTVKSRLSAFLKTALVRQAMLWLLFFLVCMSLGYPTLNRYSPAKVTGLLDSLGYSSIVTGENLAGDEAHRILVPYMAKPIYWLANRRLNTWDPVFFSLLVVNSLFIATTSFALVQIGQRILGNYAIALLSGFLYLANFAVANFNLSGYVDSALNCTLILIVWSLLADRWWLLPVWGIIGALAKETSVPLSAVLAFTWWAVEGWRGRWQWSRLVWQGIAIAVGFATLYLVMFYVSPGATPMTFATARWDNSGSSYFYLSGLLGCLLARETFFVFGWLLPLGVWRLNRLPRTWVVGSICSALAALALGAYDNALGNTVRPMFSALGPLLSLTASILLVEIGLPAREIENQSH